MIKDLLTIVIPCKNENLIIEKTLKYLNIQQDIKGTKVIIADCSNDNGYTRKCIKNEEGYNLDIQVIQGGYPSVGRNLGSELVTTEYVLFLDADIFISNVFLLSEMLDEVENKDYSLSTCKIRVLSGEYNYVYKAFDIIQSLTRFSKPFAIGGFMLFNTEEFRKLGKFCEEDKFAEDYHISMKVKPKDFYIHNDIVYTTSRRFKSKGLYYMIKMMVKSYFNRNNPEFFKKDHNYWN